MLIVSSLNICRVCSSRGSYDIFSTIPAYLHGGANEFLLWQKDISELLEETTGLKVEPNDNLPKKICALCISYLKHACTFRQQAINNYYSLKAAADLITEDSLSKKIDTEKLLNDEKIIRTRDVEREQQSSEKLSNHMNTYLNLLFDKDTNKHANNKNNLSKKKKRLNLGDDETFFAKDFDFEESPSAPVSSDENENIDKNNHFFNYKETNFEEDDIINLLKDYNITINIPESGKERKCSSCYRRFMFEDTFLDHIESCVEYKLQSSVQALNRLYGMRKKKLISPHEFIRRMFFSLKKISEWIGTLVLPENKNNVIEVNKTVIDKSENQLNNKNAEMESNTKSVRGTRCDIALKISLKNENHKDKNDALLEVLRRNSNKSPLSPEPIFANVQNVMTPTSFSQFSNELTEHPTKNTQDAQDKMNNLRLTTEHDKIIALFEEDE